MKNIVRSLIFLVWLVCIFSACNLTNDAVNNPNISKPNNKVENSVITIDDLKNPQVIDDAKFYKVLQGEGNFYYYYIFNKQNEVVDEMGFYWKEPQLSLVDDEIVKVYIHLGTGAGAIRTRYYDTKEELLSEWFNSVYDEDNNLLVYSAHNKLIVQNIFDKSSYYREIQMFSKELIETGEPFINVEFVNNATELKVTYITTDLNETTETISLK